MDFSDKKMLLAPMAGVNDPVFRALCKRMGAGFTYTEMISSKGLSYKNKKTKDMIFALPEDKPYAVQLFGNEPEVMAAEARQLEERLGDELVLIDINMGCPARKVASGGSGAVLLQQPKLALEIIKQVSSAVQVPVTVKMRLLSAEEDTATMEFACKAAAAGAQAITLHGRTAQQMYTGTATRELVAPLSRELDVPLIASGDVYSHEDIEDYLERGARAVMVARGARGNPWLFANKTPSYAELISIVREHTTRLYELDPYKLVWMRKHFAWYFRGLPHAASVRTAVQSAVELEDYLAILDRCEQYV